MTKSEKDKVLKKMEESGDYYFMNLYPYKVAPFWTMHDTVKLAESDAKLHRVVDSDIALHIAVPVHRDHINKT